MAKVLISVDDQALKRIDRAARATGKSRSAYLRDLALKDLDREIGPGKSPTTRTALRQLDSLFADSPGGDSTAAIRAARDAR
jgi:hypothetical protein